MCEKSRSYASSNARDIASFADMENAGGNCRSWDRIKGQKYDYEEFCKMDFLRQLLHDTHLMVEAGPL